MEAGTIVAWEKQEGDRIEEGEVLAIIETDKSTMEMETPEEGYLAKIFLQAGSKDVPVNKVGAPSFQIRNLSFYHGLLLYVIILIYCKFKESHCTDQPD